VGNDTMLAGPPDLKCFKKIIRRKKEFFILFYFIFFEIIFKYGGPAGIVSAMTLFLQARQT
jgi:hypothetical protein